MKTLERLALKSWVGLPDAAAIAQWAAQLPDGDTAAELRRLNSAQRMAAFEQIARERCGYPPCSPAGSAAATALLLDDCARVLNGAMSVGDFTRVVNGLDSIFVVDNVDPNVPVPLGVRFLYNALDWVDASWTIESSPELAAAIRKAYEAMLAGREPEEPSMNIMTRVVRRGR
jgi:hypothetical protein